MEKKLSDYTLDEFMVSIDQSLNDRIVPYEMEIEKKIILSKKEVCKMLHIGPYTLDKYIENGLILLPGGRISSYNLNRYLGKYPYAKNSIK